MLKWSVELAANLADEQFLSGVHGRANSGAANPDLEP
jgi:hypothetical protein